MEIIDSHAHLYPPELNRDPSGWAAAGGERHWATLCARARKDGRAAQAFPSPGELLRAMDAAGVARAVLQGWYWEKPETCAWQNRFYAECVRAHPDRLSACAALHPGAGRAADVPRVRDDARRAADTGFAGFGELSPHAQGARSPDAAADGGAMRDALHEVFSIAGEAGLAVCMHVTETAGVAGARKYPGKVETPIGDFVRWARLFPGTRFVLAHWGARLPLDEEWGGAVKTLANVFYDTAASPLIYGAKMSAGIWTEMAGLADAERILFGTDYPLELYPKNNAAAGMSVEAGAGAGMRRLLEEARGSGLGEDELKAVLGGNARRVFLQGRL